MAITTADTVFAGLGRTQGGTLYDDASPYDHDGTLVGSPTWSNEGGRNWINLNGSDQWAAIADANQLDVSGPWTIAVWVHSSDYAAQVFGQVVAKSGGTGTSETFELRFSGTTRQPQILSYIGGVLAVATSATALTNGTAYHLAARYTGSALQLFVDGVQVAETAASGVVYTGTEGMGVGVRRPLDFPQFPFFGRIADALVFASSLSGADIAWLANPLNLIGDPTGPVLRSPYVLNYLDPSQRFRSPHLIGSLR